MQVEAKRWRGGVVLAQREVCSVVYCCQTSSNRYIDREPFQVDAICWQSCIHSINSRSRSKGVVARGVGVMVWALGMRFFKAVAGLCARE